MKINGLFIYFATITLILLFSWSVVHDKVSCTVKNAGLEYVNGFYSALGGIYLKKGYHLSFIPDFFEICIIHLPSSYTSRSVLSFNELSWNIFKQPHKLKLYKNNPQNPTKYLFNPPEKDWTVGENGVAPPPIIENCSGSLSEAPNLSRRSDSNIMIMMSRPVTTLILILLIGGAYYLWSNKIDPADVAYSYDAVVINGEYWRIFTAAISHFDLLHLGFNCMSMYELGSLEPLWGSMSFAVLNVALIIITMLIHTAGVHILMTRYGYAEMGSHTGVGYSGVLFAWMVAESVRMRTFCPIFLMPSLCFTTWTLPIPGTAGFPINLGPFALLIFTKVLIVRSSFLAHLSGIIIGYPLAWNLIDWLTPPLLTCIILGATIWKEKLFVWQFPNFTLNPVLSDFVQLRQLRNYQFLGITFGMAIVVTPGLVYYYGFMEIPSRLLVCFLLWSARHARRCEWMTDTKAVQRNCVHICLVALAAVAVMSICDALSLSGAYGSWDLLLQSCDISVSILTQGLGVLILTIIMEVIAAVTLVLCLQDMSSVTEAKEWLQLLRIDKVAIEEDLLRLGVTGNTTRAFSGQSYTLLRSEEKENAMMRIGNGQNNALLGSVAVAVAESATYSNSNSIYRLQNNIREGDVIAKGRGGGGGGGGGRAASASSNNSNSNSSGGANSLSSHAQRNSYTL